MAVRLGVETQPVQKRSFATLAQELSPRLSPIVTRARTVFRKDLFSPDGYLYASDAKGNYNHAFVRDTMYVADDIRRTYPPQSEEWQKTKRAVMWFWDWQKGDIEHPDGFLPHELRKVDDKALRDPIFKEMLDKGFYSLQTKIIDGKEVTYAVNGDSIDATPLALMLTPYFLEGGNKEEFLQVLPKAIAALTAIKKNTFDHDGWLCYQGNSKGLMSQGWMDSQQGGVLEQDGSPSKEWIANVEVQAFAWDALKTWQGLLQEKLDSGEITMADLSKIKEDNVDGGYIKDLGDRADILKRRFNDPITGFKMQTPDGTYFAHALVVDKQDGKTVLRRDERISINPGFCLWANNKGETIIDDDSVAVVANRFRTVPGSEGSHGGLFSFHGSSSTFEDGSVLRNSDNYHSGYSVHWPVAANVVAKGILDVGQRYSIDDYEYKADKILYYGVIKPVMHFDGFVEQFRFDKNDKSYHRYVDENGHASNLNQTWTLSAFLYASDRFGMDEEALQDFQQSGSRRNRAGLN